MGTICDTPVGRLTINWTRILFYFFHQASAISAYLVIQEPRDDTCTRTGPKCSADCKEIVFCAVKGGESLHVASCPDFCQIPEAPADGGVAYPACGGQSCKSDGFLCLAPGGLPDPTNSTGYYLCPAVSMSGIRVQCPAEQSFDVTKRTCVAENATTIIDVPPCNGTITFAPLDSVNIFCYYCNDQGNMLVYPCSLNTDTKIFESIGYQLPLV